MGPWAFGVPLVSTLGLLLNGYILLVVFGLGKQTQQQQTANTLLLIHLGAVEAAVCLILLIFATGSWPLTGTWCVLYGFLLALLHPVALWTVTGLNCDRYYAIAAPLHYAALVSPRRVVVGLAASWTGALLLCLPPFSGLVPPYSYNKELGCCAPDFGNSTWGSAAALYGAVYAILGLGLPAVLVTVCNLRVLGIARYHRHRIASAIYEVTLSAQVTITHQRNPFFVPTVTAPSAGGPPRFHSAASTVMQLVGSLYLLYFPYCGFILWEACGAGNQHRLHAHPKLASLASLLLACSPPINGLLYGLKSQTLRRSVQNYWRKKATKSELQQEIQARTPSVAGSRRPSGSGNTSFFPFPPLQRRLSEALLALGSCRTGGSFESNNLGFQRGRLQPAVSCNTLRVPTAESERRWRHCSTGSESSTGSSDASVWTTGVVPKYGKGNAKNTDGWSSRTRYVRGKNLEEGALSTTMRPNNNSESSDTTDTTTATTTTTTLLKSLAVETGEQNEREKERMNDNIKKREFSESESSWSSVEEIETKAERNDEDDNPDRSKEEDSQTRPSRQKSKISNRDPDVSEEDAQLRPLLTPSS
ncbi:PREDICTED: beta-3 adrenergic receptor-like isoform X2 [Acromyrmex echinatior]|uniref:beta-3 adrenergic receptor-like isoform X2 n=1 Tax=Acromyrmex echinatior TaxID=103372 RepID=UPI000580F1E8|nr:PREDICTED: beta-3 adrenergic receptor-like isoform X2 [Acromyrmex echinatior]